LRHRIGTEEELILETDIEKAVISGSEVSLMKTLWQWIIITLTGSQDSIWSRPHPWNSGSVHPFTGVLNGLR
jgi:hypothetical protein